jgi:hypothetical protein
MDLPTYSKSKNQHRYHIFGFRLKSNNADPDQRFEGIYDIEICKASSLLVYFDGSKI